MPHIIDCSQRIEANWNWNTTTFISQAYKNNDQFQEFGLKWCGSGFTYITTPKWINSKYKSLDNYDLRLFCGPSIIIDLPNEIKVNTDHVEKELHNIDNINDIELTDLSKIVTIEKATHDKNYSEEDLFEFYKRFQFNISQLINTDEVYKTLSPIEGRALVYQRLLLTEDPELKLELLKTLKNIFEK